MNARYQHLAHLIGQRALELSYIAPQHANTWAALAAGARQMARRV